MEILIGIILIILGAAMMWKGLDDSILLFLLSIIIIAIGMIWIAGIVARGEVKDNRIVEDKSIHLYIARNMEDLQLDTIYAKQRVPMDRRYVWVNMDSLWIDYSDPYSTSYLIIRQITK